jgi:hypothetical protein
MYKYEVVEEKHEWIVAERYEHNNVLVQLYQFDKHENSIEEVLAYMTEHYRDFNVTLDDVLYIVDDSAEQNMPCDTYGPAACSTACPKYFVCNA